MLRNYFVSKNSGLLAHTTATTIDDKAVWRSITNLMVDFMVDAYTLGGITSSRKKWLLRHLYPALRFKESKADGTVNCASLIQISNKFSYIVTFSFKIIGTVITRRWMVQPQNKNASQKGDCCTKRYYSRNNAWKCRAGLGIFEIGSHQKLGSRSYCGKTQFDARSSQTIDEWGQDRCSWQFPVHVC